MIITKRVPLIGGIIVFIFLVFVGTVSANPIWHDTNQNAIYDTDEHGLPHVRVNLVDITGTVIASTVTDENGIYTFTRTISEGYSIEYSLPSIYNVIDGSATLPPSTIVTCDSYSNLTEWTHILELPEFPPNLGDLKYSELWIGLSGVQEFAFANFSPNTETVNFEHKLFATIDLGDNNFGIENEILRTEILAPVNSSTNWLSFDGENATQSSVFIMEVNTSTLNTDIITTGVGMMEFSTHSNGSMFHSAGGGNNAQQLLTNSTVNICITHIYDPFLGSIGDYVWHDVDGNGDFDLGDFPLRDVTLELSNQTGVISTTTTDPFGYYLFDNLNFDTYTVTVDTNTLPTDKLITPTFDFDGGFDNTSTTTINLEHNQHDRNQDFAYEPVPITPIPTEAPIILPTYTPLPPLPTYTPVPIEAPIILPTYTPLPPLPTYTPVPTEAPIILPTYTPLPPLPTYTPVPIEAPVILPTYTPTPLLGSIGDYVWHDVDGNGALDVGEFPLGDVVLILADADGYVTSTMTAPTGFYLFDDLPLGTYTVTVDTSTLLTGKLITPTFDFDGGADNTSTTTLDLDHLHDRDQDFAYEPPEPTYIFAVQPVAAAAVLKPFILLALSVLTGLTLRMVRRRGA